MRCSNDYGVFVSHGPSGKDRAARIPSSPVLRIARLALLTRAGHWVYFRLLLLMTWLDLLPILTLTPDQHSDQSRLMPSGIYTFADTPPCSVHGTSNDDDTADYKASGTFAFPTEPREVPSSFHRRSRFCGLPSPLSPPKHRGDARLRDQRWRYDCCK